MGRTLPASVTVNLSEAAALIGVGRDALRTIIKSGDLTVYRLGRKQLIRLDDIERLLGGAPIPVQRPEADAAS
jgi:excisionase family DNA binding protein